LSAYAAEARRHDSRHRPPHHLDHEALLGRRKAVRDHGHEHGRQKPAECRESRHHEEERVDDRAAQPPHVVAAPLTHVLAKGRHERDDERPAENLDDDRGYGRGINERVHLGTRAVIMRRDDLAPEAE
jgi:hypothetical protein